MDMINMFKSRVSEGEGSASEADSLRDEVEKLQGYIKSNYTVYVRKIEKRSEKIKELYKENQELKKRFEESEGYRTQLSECRENLEQLEGFQNQELAKIKHMLLGTEGSLEVEKTKRLKLEEELETLKESRKQQNERKELDLDVTMERESLQKSIDSKDDQIANLISTIEKLKEQLKNQDAPVDVQLQAALDEKMAVEEELSLVKKDLGESKKILSESAEMSKRNAESDKLKIEELKTELASVSHERDSYKNSILELEIAQHDGQEEEKRFIKERKLELAKLATEKETLEMKLTHRDSEIKKLKEEFRNSKEEYHNKIQELEESLKVKGFKVIGLEAQIRDSKEDISGIKSDLEAQLSRSVELSTYLKSKESECIRVQGLLQEKIHLLNETKSSEESLREELCEQKKKFDQLNGDLEHCVSQIEELSRNREILEKEIREKREALSRSEVDIRRLNRQLEEIDRNLPQTIENSDLVKDLKSKNKTLENDLDESKIALKFKEKRMNEMKKTLQKEILRSNNNQDLSVPGHNLSTSASASSLVPVHEEELFNNNGHARVRKDSSSSSVDIPTADVNIKYLKRVILKFFTGREKESHQMIKVISTILKFSPEESKLLYEIWEWQFSWFGTKPKKTLSFNN